MPKHLDIRIYGKVQGVLFRASARAKALDLGIKGFVRNDTDGSVYIEAEGDPKELEHFIDWCHHGPVMAEVVRIETKEGSTQNYKDFSVN